MFRLFFLAFKDPLETHRAISLTILWVTQTPFLSSRSPIHKPPCNLCLFIPPCFYPCSFPSLLPFQILPILQSLGLQSECALFLYVAQCLRLNYLLYWSTFYLFPVCQCQLPTLKCEVLSHMEVVSHTLLKVKSIRLSLTQ